jgi:glutamine synthetase
MARRAKPRSRLRKPGQLPSSLGEALDLMAKSDIVSGWLPDLMRQSYVAVKRKDIEMFAGATPEGMCKRYHDAY